MQNANHCLLSRIWVGIDEKETESLVKADALGDGLVSTVDSDDEDEDAAAGSGTLYQKSLKSVRLAFVDAVPKLDIARGVRRHTVR